MLLDIVAYEHLRLGMIKTYIEYNGDGHLPLLEEGQHELLCPCETRDCLAVGYAVSVQVDAVPVGIVEGAVRILLYNRISRLVVL